MVMLFSTIVGKPRKQGDVRQLPRHTLTAPAGLTNLGSGA